MDLLLRLLFYGGKYLSKFTAESMTVGGRLRTNMERFPIGGNQESMMDLYSQNMNEIGGYCAAGRRGRLQDDDYRTSRIGRMSLPNFVDEQYRNIERKIKYDSTHAPQGRSRRGRPRRRKAKSTIAPKRTYQELQNREQEFVQKKELLRKFSQANFSENHTHAMKRRKTIPLIVNRPISREEAGRLQRKNELEFKKFEMQLEEKIYSDRLREIDLERLGEVGIDEEVLLKRLQSVGDWRSRVYDKNLQAFTNFEETLGRLDDTYRLVKNREAFQELEHRLLEDRCRSSAKNDDLAFKAFLSRLEDVRVRKGRTRRFMEKVSREFEAYRRDLGSSGLTKKLEVKELFERMLVTETKVYVPESVDCREFAGFVGPQSEEKDDFEDEELWGRINRSDVEEPIVRSSRKVFGFFEESLGDREVQKKMSKIKEELPILPDFTPKLKKPRFHIPVIYDMRPVDTVRSLPLRKPFRCYNSAHTLHNSPAKDRTRTFSTNHPNFEKNVREIVQYKIASNIFFAEPKRRVSGLMPGCLAKFKKVVTRYRLGSTTKQSPPVMMYERMYESDRCDLPIWDRSEFSGVDHQTCSGDVLEAKADVVEELREDPADQKNMYQRVLDSILQQHVVTVKEETPKEPVVVKECNFILEPSKEESRKEKKCQSLQVVPISKNDLIPCDVEAVKVDETEVELGCGSQKKHQVKTIESTKILPSEKGEEKRLSRGSFRKFKRPEISEGREQKDKNSEKDDWECVLSSSHHFMPKAETSNLALRQFLRCEGKVEVKKPQPVRTEKQQQNVHKFLQSAEKIAAKFKPLDKVKDTNWSTKCDTGYKNVSNLNRKQDNVVEGPVRHHRKIARAESAKEHKGHHVKHAKKVHSAEGGHRLKHRKKEHKSERLRSDETAGKIKIEAIPLDENISKKVPVNVQYLEVKSSHGNEAVTKTKNIALDVAQSPLKSTDQDITFDKLRKVNLVGELHEPAVKSNLAAFKVKATTLNFSEPTPKSTDQVVDKQKATFGVEDCNVAGNVIDICCEEDWTPDLGTQNVAEGQKVFPGDVLDEFIMEMDALRPQTGILDEVGQLDNFETAFEQEIGIPLIEEALKKEVVKMKGPLNLVEEKRKGIKKMHVTKPQAPLKFKEETKISLNEDSMGTSNREENFKTSLKEEIGKMNVAATPLEIVAKPSLEKEETKGTESETIAKSTPPEQPTRANLKKETRKPMLQFKNVATKKFAIEEKVTPVHRADSELKEEILKLQERDLLEKRTVELLQEEMTNSLIEDMIGADVQEITTSQDQKLASLRELLKNDVPEVIKQETNVQDQPKIDEKVLPKGEDKPLQTNVFNAVDEETIKMQLSEIRKSAFAVHKPDVNWKKFGRCVAMKNSPIVTFGPPRKDVKEDSSSAATEEVKETKKDIGLEMKSPASYRLNRIVANEDRKKENERKLVDVKRLDGLKKFGMGKDVKKSSSKEDTRVREEEKAEGKNVAVKLVPLFGSKFALKKDAKDGSKGEEEQEGLKMVEEKMVPLNGPKVVAPKKSTREESINEERPEGLKMVEKKIVPLFGPKGFAPKKDAREEGKGEERMEELKIKDKKVEAKFVPVYGPKGVALKKNDKEESKSKERLDGLKMVEEKLVPLYGPKRVALKKEARNDSKGEERLEELKIQDKQVEVKMVPLYRVALRKDANEENKSEERLEELKIKDTKMEVKQVLKGAEAKKYAREESKGEEKMEALKVKRIQVEKKQVSLVEEYGVKKEDAENEQKAEEAKIMDKNVGSLYVSALKKDVAKNYTREATRNEDGLEETTKHVSDEVDLKSVARDKTKNEETGDSKVEVEESKSNGSLDDMRKAVLVKMEKKTAAKKADEKPATNEPGIKLDAKENLVKNYVKLDCGSQDHKSRLPTKVLLSEIEESKIATPTFAQKVDNKVDSTRKLVLSKIEEVKDISEKLVLDDVSSKIEESGLLRPKSEVLSRESKIPRPSSSTQVYQLLGKPRTGEIAQGNSKKLVLSKVESGSRPTFAANVDELLNVSGSALAKCGNVSEVLDQKSKVVAEVRYSKKVVDEEEVKKEDLKVAVSPTKPVEEVESTPIETVEVEHVVEVESVPKYGRIDEVLAGKLRAKEKGYADRHKSIEELLGGKRLERPEYTTSKEDLLKGLQRNVQSARQVGMKIENLFVQEKPSVKEPERERRKSPPEKIINIHCKIGLAEIEPVLAALNDEMAEKTVRKVSSLSKLRGLGHSKFDKPTEKFITVHELANMDEVGVKFYSDICNAKPVPFKLAKPASTYKSKPLKLQSRNDTEHVIKTASVDLDRVIKIPKKPAETFVSLQKQFQFSGPLKIFASEVWNNETELTLPRSAVRMEKAEPPPPPKVETKKVHNKYKYETKMVKTSLGKTMPVTFLVREAAGSP